MLVIGSVFRDRMAQLPFAVYFFPDIGPAVAVNNLPEVFLGENNFLTQVEFFALDE